ncbi:MAG: N-acyl-D-amino-acid deacylase family protein [Chloroflexota bacterium]
MLELSILNGKVIDGAGNPWYRANIGVKDGRIVAIGREVGEAERIIDAQGWIVAPGFIDMHTHSGASLLADPRGESAVRQGVTTHVIGNCGHSTFPLSEPTTSWLARFNVEPTWQDLTGYAARMREQGMGLNVVPLVGHGPVRAAAMGEADRPPDPDELEAMKYLVAQAMEAGAFGMSTGLIYPPGSFAKTDELIALARVVAEHGGFYASHIRGEGVQVIDAVREAIQIGEQADLPVQISHHKAASRQSWGLVNDTLSVLEMARARGVDVTWDQYPYLATSTGLRVFVPEWAHDGGTEALLERMHAPETRQRILAELQMMDKNWSDILIISCPTHKEWQGLRLPEIAERLELPPEEAILEILLAENAEVGMVNFAMCEADVETVMRHPVTMIGSDGLAVAVDGPTSQARQHPRSFGTFPRVLGRYVRERGVLSLEDAVRKMSSAPAQRLGLRDRGLLREGSWADIVIFDPDRVIDRATFAEPHQYPEGIAWVLVNGQLVVERETHTGQLPGKVLLRE